MAVVCDVRASVIAAGLDLPTRLIAKVCTPGYSAGKEFPLDPDIEAAMVRREARMYEHLALVLPRRWRPPTPPRDEYAGMAVAPLSCLCNPNRSVSFMHLLISLPLHGISPRRYIQQVEVT